MTSKVELTQEQADAIEKFMKDNGNDKNDLIDWFAVNRKYRKSVNDEYKPMCDLRYSELSKALYIGYEVEPRYKVGDWIRYSERTYQINEILHDEHLIHLKSGNSSVSNVPYSFIRHATPTEIKQEKERRFWKSIDREVGEFRVGDIYVDNRGEGFQIMKNPKGCYNQVSIHEVNHWYSDDDFKALYTMESRKNLEVS